MKPLSVFATFLLLLNALHLNGSLKELYVCNLTKQQRNDPVFHSLTKELTTKFHSPPAEVEIGWRLVAKNDSFNPKKPVYKRLGPFFWEEMKIQGLRNRLKTDPQTGDLYLAEFYYLGSD